MAGKIITIQNDCGTSEVLEMLCSFDYGKNQYFLAKNPKDGELLCSQVKWNVIKGTYRVTKPVSDAIMSVADALLNLSYSRPAYYKMRGEHYRICHTVQNGNRETEYVKCDRPSINFNYLMLRLSSLTSFAIAMLFATVLAYVYGEISGINWVRSIFPNATKSVAETIIHITEALGTVIIFAVRKERRGLADLCLNAFIPLNLLTLLSLAVTYSAVRIAGICIIAVFLLYCSFPVIYAFLTKCSKKVRTKIKKRALGKIYTFVLASALICMFTVCIFEIDAPTPKMLNGATSISKEEITENYNNALKNIHIDAWNNLSSSELIYTLQSICDYECTVTLGCPTAKVIADYPDALGQYSRNDNTIQINVDHMLGDTPRSVVISILHETRHAYQYSVVDALNDVEDSLDEQDMQLPFFKYAQEMRENLNNYTTAKKDIDEYFEQAVEIDSRTWAETETTKRYDKYIFKGLIKEKKEDKKETE